MKTNDNLSKPVNITATHINYFHICQRKLWLFSNGIQMEHTSNLVATGRLIAENTYNQRAKKYKELQIGNIKIDHYDAKNKIIREVKKSNKMETAHEAQLKYYLWVLEQIEVKEAIGILEYPKLRKTKEIRLKDEDRRNIKNWLVEIEKIMLQPNCPSKLNNRICKKCAYYEFCYV